MLMVARIVAASTILHQSCTGLASVLRCPSVFSMAMPALDLRTATAVAAARVAGSVSRALRRGGGTALPGLVAERIAPGLLATLAAQLPQGAVVVTGTNGKTTT